MRRRSSAEGASVSRICSVRTFIAGQLGLLWDRSDDYPWYTSTRDYHLAQVRKFTGWRFLTAQDKLELEQWLRREAAYESQSAETLSDAACERLRRLRVEVLAEKELERVVSSALSTLRRAEAVSGDSERSVATLSHPFVRMPGVIPGKVDVLPSERRNIPEQGRVERM